MSFEQESIEIKIYDTLVAMRYITNTFLSIEDRARAFFERFPFVHAFLAGVGVILFWRGVWELADYFQIHPVISVFAGIVLLVAIGLFIQTFVGNAIIIKSVTHSAAVDKKILHEIESEVVGEEVTLLTLNKKIDALAKKFEEKA